MTETLATGIEVLDRKLDGGIPAGKVLVLSAPPVSQSELFLHEMASVRPTIYLTTERTVTDIRESLRQTETPTEGIEVRSVDTGDPLSDATEIVKEMSAETTLILDRMQLLERSQPEPYVAFLNDLKEWTAETGSLSVLHCLEGRNVPVQRDRTEYLADIVFSLSSEVRGGTLQNDLAVPKFRGGEALEEAIDLDLTTDVNIDVSRKIA